MRRALRGTLLLLVAASACATATPAPSAARARAPAESAAEPEVEPAPSSEAYRALLESELRMQQGDPGAAVDLLREATLHDPRSAWLRIRLGEAYVEAGDFEAARAAAEAALERDPKNVEAMRLLALVLDLSGDRRRAEEVLRRALHVRPGDRATSTMLAEMLVAGGRVAEAEAVVEKMMAREPGAVDAWISLARVFAERGDLGRALVHLDRALAREPLAVDALRLKQDLLLAQGRYAEALPLAKTLADEEGDSPQTRSGLLVAHLLAGRDDEARDLATAWLDEDGSERMRALVADAYEVSGHRDRAVEVLLGGADASRSPRLRVEAARMRAGARRWSEVEELACGARDDLADERAQDYATALCVAALVENGRAAEAASLLRASPRLSSSWRLVQALARVAKDERAGVTKAEVAALAERALAERPDDVDLVDAVAHAYEDVGEVAQARLVLETALKSRPRDPELQMALARFLERSGERRAAVEIAERLLDRSRADVEVLNFVAFTLAEEGHRADDARRYAWRALVQEPLNGYVVDTLGWAELAAGDATAALATLSRADRLSPDEPEILLHLAEAQRRVGHDDEALRSAERALALLSKDDPLLSRVSTLVGTLRRAAP